MADEEKKLPTVKEIKSGLEMLAELQASVAEQKRFMTELIDALFEANPDAKERRDAIQDQIDIYQEQVDDQVEQVKDKVLLLGESVKGEDLQAVWSKGKTSWNSQQLLGFAKAHKEILEMRKEGAPSISIRKVKK
jgi:hypothetical protein